MNTMQLTPTTIDTMSTQITNTGSSIVFVPAAGPPPPKHMTTYNKQN